MDDTEYIQALERELKEQKAIIRKLTAALRKIANHSWVRTDIGAVRMISSEDYEMKYFDFVAIAKGVLDAVKRSKKTKAVERPKSQGKTR